MQIQEDLDAANGQARFSSDPAGCPGVSSIPGAVGALPGDTVHVTVFPNGATAWSVTVVTR